jgi:hypothetical protein
VTYKHAMWQGRVVGSHTSNWREVTATPHEPTVEQRVAYLREYKRKDGSPTYEFRELFYNDGHNPTPMLRTFLDAAAGEGLVLGGVDAADLYLLLFGPPITP